MKKLVLLSFILFSLQNIFAQETKMSFSLQKKIKKASEEKTVDRKIALFVKGNVEEIKSKTEQLGGVFKYAAGNIAAIVITISKVEDVASLASIIRIEDNNLEIKPLNDQAILTNHVLEVQQGWGLPQGYDGRGVVVGVIDVGIDPTHPDFRNTDGTTRIKYLWDQSVYNADTSKSPHPYNYGLEYRGAQVDTANSNHLDGYDSNSYSHGSHVTGSACGNGNALNNYKGMAPKSDIIVVKIDEGGNGNQSSLVDAVKYIFDMADSLHEPAVINMSIGTYFGSHDGKDIQAESIDNLITFHSGRVVVAAAGNSGAAPIHLGYNVATDTTFTWFQYQSQYIYFQFWGELGDFDNAEFSIGIDRVMPDYKFLGGTPFATVASRVNVYKTDTIYSGANRLGIVETQVQLLHGSYVVELIITPDSILTATNNYFWRLMTKGSGRLDGWGYDMVSSGLPGAATFPFITKYKKPDTDETIVSSFQCSDKVITVGSSTNRNAYTNCNFQQTADTTLHPGELSAFSSHGPTRDGKIKPDITAYGGWVLSCGGQAFLNDEVAVEPMKVAAGKKHFRSSGTSMSSPEVAGICALYLQQNPNASWSEVKDAVCCSASRDAYTGNNLPNSFWGCGKANALNMVKGCLIGIDETEFAKIETSSFPNPFSDFTTVSYDITSFSSYAPAEIKICDAMGKVIREISLQEKSGSINIERNELKSGVYFCSLVVEGRVVKTNKLVVL